MGPLDTNTYILSLNQEALIIDPSFTTTGEFNRIQNTLADDKLIGILLTHGHIDHIAGIETLLEHYDVPVYINPLEKKFLADPALNLSSMIGTPLSLNINTLDLNAGLKKIGSFEFEIMDTPGHTSGLQSFLFDQDLFCGDFLFKNGVGRMDLVTGSQDVMLDSIERFITRFPNDDFTIYSGHGQKTSLQTEIKNNPYIQYVRQQRGL